MKALTTDPTDHECHNNLGIVLASQGLHDNTIQHFKETFRLKPDSLDAKNNLELPIRKQVTVQGR